MRRLEVIKVEERKTLWEMVTGWPLVRGGPTGGDPVVRRSFTASDAEYKHAEDMAVKNGMSTSSYIRLLLLKDLKEGGMSMIKERNKLNKVEKAG